MSGTLNNPLSDIGLASLLGLGGNTLPPPQHTITLDTPIDYQGGTFENIVLREPMIDEQRQAQDQLRNGNTASAQTLYQMHLISKVSGWPFPVVQRLPVSKVNEAMFYLSGFLLGGLPTGANSPQS